ncbi:MAG: molybdopterin converting factor subunit 1 [Georgfuchsia sp.]
MIRILFFAHLRESLGSGETLPCLPEIATVAALRDLLAKRGGVWQTLETTRNLRAAVNQTMVGLDAAVKDGDEVAFFPPVTGG